MSGISRCVWRPARAGGAWCRYIRRFADCFVAVELLSKGEAPAGRRIAISPPANTCMTSLHPADVLQRQGRILVQSGQGRRPGDCHMARCAFLLFPRYVTKVFMVFMCVVCRKRAPHYHITLGSCLHVLRALKHPRWEDFKYERQDPSPSAHSLYWLGNGMTRNDGTLSGTGDRAWYLREGYVDVPPGTSYFLLFPCQFGTVCVPGMINGD